MTAARRIDRSYIVSEIKRTAVENAGVPLGRARFEQATGIKPTDWEGKFWIRWSDAVLEAGLEPNEFNTGESDDVLLERLASLVSRLGRLPLKTELQMASWSDPDFPSYQLLCKRFGEKAQRAARLLAFCESRPDLRHVADVCRPHAAQSTPKASDEQQSTDVEVFGVVYLLRSSRFYKIGRSNAAGRRERELAIQLPERATLVHEIRTDDPAGIEAYWHGRFANKRVNGEWFRLSGDDVAAFKRRRFM